METCPHLLPRNYVTFGTLFNENITFPDIIIAENNVLIRSSFAVKRYPPYFAGESEKEPADTAGIWGAELLHRIKNRRSLYLTV